VRLLGTEAACYVAIVCNSRLWNFGTPNREKALCFGARGSRRGDVVYNELSGGFQGSCRVASENRMLR
jgi:hypothetical protein